MEHTDFSHTLPWFKPPERRELPDELPEVMVATSCKDANEHLERYFRLVGQFDYPASKVHLCILEGDSSDNSRETTMRLLAANKDRFASTELIEFDLKPSIDPAKKRWDPSIQRVRRSTIAKCRNRLLDAFMHSTASHILFVDADMEEIDPGALKQILEFDAPIAIANCLRADSGEIYDMNTFRYLNSPTKDDAADYVLDGIYQPPIGYNREYPDPHSANSIEQVHCVGATFLLIRRDVIEAGVNFPAEPYQLHIESEGLALKAADYGFGSFVLPHLIVRHCAY